MPFRMQLKIGEVWRDIAPSGGKPYEYETEEEAERMLNMCYPDQIREHKLGGEEVARVVYVSNMSEHREELIRVLRESIADEIEERGTVTSFLDWADEWAPVIIDRLLRVIEMEDLFRGEEGCAQTRKNKSAE